MNTSTVVIYADTHSGLPTSALTAALRTSTIKSYTSTQQAILAFKNEPQEARAIIVDIGRRGLDILPEIDALAEECEVGTRVVALGETGDAVLYRELTQRGIVEYLTYPVDIAAVVNLLKTPQSTDASPQRPPSGYGTAVGFYAAASGNGSSTVALNTAYALANLFQRPTVLVDLDYQFGMVARYLSIQAPYGIRELLEYPERGIDTALVNTMAAPYSKYLRVIAAPKDLRVIPPVEPHMIHDLIRALKTEFAFVVLDIPHLWTDWIIALQRQMDHNFIVSELWLRSLTHLTRVLAAWREHDIGRDKATLIMNRVGSKYKEAISMAEFERVSTLHPGILIPNDSKTVTAAENSGKTVLEIGDSEIGRSYKQIAHAIYGLNGGTAGSVPQKKRGISTWFSQ